MAAARDPTDAPTPPPGSRPWRAAASSAVPPTIHVPWRSRPGRYALGADPMWGRIHAQQICCPFGHGIKDGWLVVTDDTHRCKHAAVADPRRECGSLVYVLGDNSRLGLLDVYEVDHKDMETIVKITDALETLAYLGAPIWRPPATPTRGDVARR
jgi:hypothetical protein